MFPADQLATIFGPDRFLRDSLTRSCYASDASIYAIYPEAVLLVRSPADLRQIIELSRQYRFPLTPRGAGTGLSGGAIGSGLILDFSGYSGIINFNQAEKLVTVRVGTIYDELNRYLKKYGLMFAPDPSSGDTCQIGGMLANNASGPRTVRYGTTKDYVERLSVFLPSGKEIDAKRFSVGTPEYQKFLQKNYEFTEIESLIRNHTSLIFKRTPQVKKNSSGYNLYDLAQGFQQGFFDLPKLFVGSEGTLGLFTEVTLRLVPLPTQCATVLAYFNKTQSVGDTVLQVLPLKPSALEIVDSHALDLVGRERFGIPSTTKLLLLIEFDSGDLTNLIAQTQKVLERYKLTFESISEYKSPKPVDRTSEEAFWNIRKAVLPTLYRRDQFKRPVGFVEDCCLPVEQVPHFLEFLNERFQKYQVEAGIYGHIGDGNVHIRPLLDIHGEADWELMQKLYQEIYAEVIKQGGALAAEHGDGRLRAPLVKELYGAEMYALFVQIKRLLDPANLFNPGVKLNAEPFTKHIDLQKLTQTCAACGKCNTVCPSYDISRTERLGSRGWVRALTVDWLSNQQAEQAIEACLNCKACLVSCPAGVDTSAIIRERRQQIRKLRFQILFSLMNHPNLFEHLVALIGKSQPVWDRYFFRSLFEKLFSGFVSMPATMALPKIAAQSSHKRFNSIRAEHAPLAYFPGCSERFVNNGIAEAVLEVLRKLGLRVTVPMAPCCGAPMETLGFPESVRKNARLNIRLFEKCNQIIVSNGSCYGVLKNYPHWFSSTEHEYDLAEKFADKIFDFSEFLLKYVSEISWIKKGFNKTRRRVTYHDPCHLRAAGITAEPRQLLRLLPEVELVEMPDAERCCGAGGLYRYLHYQESIQIVQRKVRGIAECQPDLVATSNSLCAWHIADGIKNRIPVVHISQIVNEYL